MSMSATVDSTTEDSFTSKKEARTKSKTVQPDNAIAGAVRRLKEKLPEGAVRNALENHVIPVVQGFSVQEYVLPAFGTWILMLICYFLGRSGWSLIWIALFTGLNLLKSKLWRDKQRRMMAMQETARREKEVVLRQLESKFDELPSWVQFPDTERVEWLNKMILQLWPYIGQYTEEFINEFIVPKVKDAMPGPFKSFSFERIDMGDIPVRVTGIKVYSEYIGRDRIVCDVDVVYAGDSEFVVVVGGFKAGMDTLQFKGKMRLIATPLVPKPPLAAAVTAFFLDNPTIDFNLTGIGGVVELPGLFSTMKSVVEQQVANICVMPNSIVVPLMKDVDLVQLNLPNPDGVLRIHLAEARNLENIDLALLHKGKSDPYAKISVGGTMFRSRVVNNNLNPKWDEWFEAIVGTAAGQRLSVEIYDEDDAGKDDYMGSVSIDIGQVKDKGKVENWYTIEMAKHGELKLGLYWIELSFDPRDITQSKWNQDWEKLNPDLFGACLMVYVDSIKDLPTRGATDPSAYLKLTSGKIKHKTGVRLNTPNPVFERKFVFMIQEPEHDSVNFEALQQGSERSLGTLSIPIRSLFGEPQMQVKQRTFALTMGMHQSSILLSLKLLAFKPSHGTGKKL